MEIINFKPLCQTTHDYDELVNLATYIENTITINHPIIYNVLLIGSKSECTTFVTAMNDYLSTAVPSLTTDGCRELPENIDDENVEVLYQNNNDRILYLSIPDRANQDILTSFETLITKAREHADRIHVLCVSEKQAQILQGNGYGYHQIFAHHIALKQTVPPSVFDIFKSQMNARNLSMSDTFEKEIRKYIAAAYPLSEQSAENFEKDLESKVLSRYYSRSKVGDLDITMVPYIFQEDLYNQTIGRLNRLIGLTPIKEELSNLKNIADNPKRGFSGKLNYAFGGKEGTGKETIAEITANLLFALGLRRSNTITKTELSDLADFSVAAAGDGVLQIDIHGAEERMNQLSEAAAEKIQSALEKFVKRKTVTVVLIGNQSDTDYLLANKKLKPYITCFTFPNYTVDELVLMFKAECEENHLTVERKNQGYLVESIRNQLADDAFAYGDTIEDMMTLVMRRLELKQDKTDVIERADLDIFLLKNKAQSQILWDLGFLS